MFKTERRRRVLSSEVCDDIIKRYQKIISINKVKRSQYHEAYEYVFQEIQDCEKKSSRHLMLLFIEDVLDREGSKINQEMEAAKRLADVYTKKKEVLLKRGVK